MSTSSASSEPPKKDLKGKGKDGKKAEEEAELTPEDKQLKENLELMVERVQDDNHELQLVALEMLQKELRASTSSMTGVPKPLKFLRPHFTPLASYFSTKLTSPDAPNRKIFADLLSVLAMTVGSEDDRQTLSYKLQGNLTDCDSWGHEYVRSLSGELAAEYGARTAAQPPTLVDDLLPLVKPLVTYHIAHNTEPDACDLLTEVDQLERILDYVDKTNHERICLYLSSCAAYAPEPEDAEILRVVVSIYRRMSKLPEAMRFAMKLNDAALAAEIFKECPADAGEGLVKKQLAFMLARHNYFIDVSDDDTIAEIINNTRLAEWYLALAADLDVLEPKTPEDIYKTHLLDNRAASAVNSNVDSARANLASTFVNAFVNAGFSKDKLLTEDDGAKWLYKNKDHGMLSAAASLGMILQWHAKEINQMDKFVSSRDDNIRAGALLAVGLLYSGVRDEFDPALGLLSEHVTSPLGIVRICSSLALGLAYSGSARDDLLQLLQPLVEDSTSTMEVQASAALALGMIFVGTGNADITGAIVQAFFERDDEALKSPHTRFLCLALGLLYMGTGETAELTMEALQALEDRPFGPYAALTVETCAYAGTGNVLQVQKLMRVCGEHPEKENPAQAVAVLGIAIIALGEEIGAEMCVRSFSHLLQYGEPTVRRVVPLALGLLSISRPVVGIVDTLSKLSHDNDEETAQHAVFALGLVGAGTNNARIAQLLRSLAAFHSKNQHSLFIVRLAQGLLHMGKGLLGLSPLHSDRLLLKQTALAGLLVVLHAMIDAKATILGQHHYLMFMLSSAIFPRMLMTLDADLNPVKTTVRVGQAVDVVGQAGRPKTITGFQTHTTPVLLGMSDRAELATDEYLASTTVLEGLVLLRPNPNAEIVDLTSKSADAKGKGPANKR